MKTDVVVLVVAVIFVKATKGDPIPTTNKTLETAHYTCLLGSDIRINTIKDSLDGFFTDDKHLVQYFQCMFRMYNLLDNQGNLKNETIFDAIHILEKDQSYTEKAVSVCQEDKVHKNATQHEIAYEFFKCFRNLTEDAYYWSILKYLLSKQSVYTALTPTQSLKLETVHYTCAVGSDVQLKPIKASLNGIYPKDDDKLVEYFKCVFRMYGFVDIEGNIKNETMLNSIPAEDRDRLYTEEAIKICQYVEPETKPELAYEFFKCFRNATDKAEYWTTLKELSDKSDKQDVANVFVDFL